jgi:hypothetical protein
MRTTDYHQEAKAIVKRAPGTPAVAQQLRDLQAAVKTLAARMAALEGSPQQGRASAGPAEDLSSDPFLDTLHQEVETWLPHAERVEGMTGLGGFVWACGREPEKDMTYRTAIGSLSEMWRADLSAAAQYLQAIASVPRLKLLKAMFIGRRSARELMGAAGLSKGQAYGNLAKLTALGLVRQPERDQYDITVLGSDLLALALAAGGDIVGPHAASRERAPRPPESLELSG